MDDRQFCKVICNTGSGRRNDEMIRLGVHTIYRGGHYRIIDYFMTFVSCHFPENLAYTAGKTKAMICKKLRIYLQ